MADLSQNPFALLSLIAAPAVLTNAASVLVMSTTNRFLRASERMRALAVRVEEKKLTPGLRLLVRCAPLPQPVYVDRAMWEKIVLNLISNAFKFTFEGQIEVTLAARDGA